MIKIYHVTGTRGTRLIWLCEELQLEYSVQTIDFSAEYRASPEWRALNPVGKVPVMQDGNVTMFESGAMLQYTLDRYANGALQPSVEHPDYPEYLQWLWFAEATLARPLGEIVNHGREFPNSAKIEAVVDEMRDRACIGLEAVAARLSNRNYLLGDTFSAADIMMGYSIQLAYSLVPEHVPADLEPYWQRLTSRAAMQIAMRA